MTELYILGNTTPYQMFGAVLLTRHHCVVIDGGLEEDAPQLKALLDRLGKREIDAWFFTHPHHDHLGAFMVFAKEYRSVSVKKLYLHFPHRETLRLCPAHKAHGGIERTMWEEIWNLLEGEFSSRYEKIEKGNVFSFDDVTLHVLRVMNPSFDIKKNFVNNSSAVFRIDTPKKRVLLLGDLGVEGGRELMATVPAEELFAHYTQMAHHGQKGVERACYEYLRPQRCIWPTPEKIWDNIGDDGPGTGKWLTAETRSWMDEMGVLEHIVEKDGTARIILDGTGV